jgi:predicted anti-sigma-YlaC factor YlaD
MDTGQDCLRAWEAMPWVLQESAPPEQSEWLKGHLAHCESCRAEFNQQNRLRLAMSLPTDIRVDAHAGLQRLMNRIDAAAHDETPYRMRAGSWLARGLVAAVLIQAIGIGVLGAKLYSSSEKPVYRTLSQQAAPVGPGAIRVVPDASMTLTDWDAVLHTLHLQVVAGPNEVGAYTVALISNTSTQQAVQQLRATRGIRLAEPIVASP